MPVYLVPIDPGDPVPIQKSVVLFGRHPGCDVVLHNSKKVSRKHCCLAVVDNAMFLRDLGSMNGIRVNGTKVDRIAQVKIGDELAIGDVRFRLMLEKVVLRPPQPAKRTVDESTPLPAADRDAPRVVPTSPVPADLDLSQSGPVIIPETLDGESDDELDVIPLDESDLITLSDSGVDVFDIPTPLPPGKADTAEENAKYDDDVLFEDDDDSDVYRLSDD